MKLLVISVTIVLVLFAISSDVNAVDRPLNVSLENTKHEKQITAEETFHYYFGYGSNLNDDFMQERLKDGEWIDSFHRNGRLIGAKPIDLGCYMLNDYEFEYSLDAESFGDKGTTANLIPKWGSVVYGVLYKISSQHLEKLDHTEDTPIAYQRIPLPVRRVEKDSTQNNPAPKEVNAWVYIGQEPYIISKWNPDPDYVNILLKGAYEHRLPENYIKKYIIFLPLQMQNVIHDSCSATANHNK